MLTWRSMWNDWIGAAPNVFYGVNIHPYTAGSAGQLMSYIKALNCNMIRSDIYDGSADALALVPYCQAAASRGMQVVPCLAFNTPVFTNNESANYAGYYPLAQAMGRVLKNYCPIFEISNEMSEYCGSGNGESPSDYNQAKYADCRGVIRACIDGIKSVFTAAQIVAPAGTVTKTGFPKMLWNGTNPNGTSGSPQVRWDFTSWHWYESSANIESGFDGTGSAYNVLSALATFGKPIWLTEVGFDFDDSAVDQSSYVLSAMAHYYAIRNTYDIQNICWYALADDPGGTFGLMLDDAVTSKGGFAAFAYFAENNLP